MGFQGVSMNHYLHLLLSGEKQKNLSLKNICSVLWGEIEAEDVRAGPAKSGLAALENGGPGRQCRLQGLSEEHAW